jgi:hypothetical protein
VRDVDKAFTKLNRSQELRSRRIRVERVSPLDKGKALEDAHDSSEPSPSTTNTVPFPSLAPRAQTEDIDAAQVVTDAVGKVRPRSVSAGHSDKSPTSATASRPAEGFPELNGNPFPQQDVNGRRPSNCLFFDEVKKGSAGLRTTEPATNRLRSLSFGQSSAGETPNGHVVGEHEFDPPSFSQFYAYPQHTADPERQETYYATPFSSYYPSVYNVPHDTPPRFSFHSPMNMNPVATPRPFVSRYPLDPAFMNPHVPFSDSTYFPPIMSHPTVFYHAHGPLPPPPPVHPPPYIPQPHFPVEDPRFAFADPMPPVHHPLYSAVRSPPRPTDPEPARPSAHHLRTRRTNVNDRNDRADAPEGNRLNMERIEAGVDMRTTVMIQNIPIKMTDKDLEKFIADVCPRRIDFMYLRMDFETREWSLYLVCTGFKACFLEFRLHRRLCVCQLYYGSRFDHVCES